MPVTSLPAFSATLKEVGATVDPNSSVITPQLLDSFLSGSGTPWASAKEAVADAPSDGGEPVFYSPPGTPLVAIRPNWGPTPWQSGYPTELAIPAAAAVGRPTIAEGPGNNDVGLTVIGLDGSDNWIWAADFEQMLPNSTPDPTEWEWSDFGYTDDWATFTGQWMPVGAGELASGLSIPGLLILQAEVAAGVIPHMIGITVADLPTGTNGCTYGNAILPATEQDRSMPISTALVPRYGQVYSFPAGMAMPTNLSCEYAEILWTCIQNYGAVLCNRDGDWLKVGFTEIPQAGAGDHVAAALGGVSPGSALGSSFWHGLELVTWPSRNVWPRTIINTPTTPPATPPSTDSYCRWCRCYRSGGGRRNKLHHLQEWVLICHFDIPRHRR